MLPLSKYKKLLGEDAKGMSERRFVSFEMHSIGQPDWHLRSGKKNDWEFSPLVDNQA